MVGAGINVYPSMVAVPPGVVTLTVPEVPVSTTAVMLVALTTLNEVAAVPPKLTAVAPVKLVPVMVTVVPKLADSGVMEVMVGGGIKINPSWVTVPSGVVTLTLPEVPFATMAEILVTLITVNEVAAVPPKLTAVTPVKLVPVMVTVAPVAADAGVKEVMVGVGSNVNPARVPVPPGDETLTVPEVPVATTAVMLVLLTTLNEVAAVPPKLTAVAPVKLVPVRVTVAPEPADSGVMVVMVGSGKNVNPARVPVPPRVVTLTVPDVPLATTAVMFVTLTTLNEVAAVPPKLTVVAPVRLVPVMVTVAPVPADAGVKEVMVGKPKNANPARVAVPPGVVTLTLPVAPFATTAVMLVALPTLNDEAAVSPKLMAVAPVKLVPVMVTVSPPTADVGVKEAMAGAGGETVTFFTVGEAAVQPFAFV